MAQGQGKGGPQEPPKGHIRLSQLVTTFGPGAMVDLIDHAVLIGGLDFWRYDPSKPTPVLDEPRLRAEVAPLAKALGMELSKEGSFRTGPPGDDSAATYRCGIQVAEFPTWFICQRCRALEPRRNLDGATKSGKYKHQCTRTQSGECVPVRFVATCKRGHLEEFPWKWFVHGKAENPRDCDGRELVLEEGPSGDFSEIVVHCKSCGARRSMSDAREDRVLLDCRGERPWLGEQGRQPECTEKLHLLSRFASNAYFSQVVSALSIPEKERILEKAVSSAKLWPYLGEARDAETVAFFRKKQKIIDESLSANTQRPASDFTDQDIADAVNAIHGGSDQPREGLRTAEFKQFLGARDEVPGELPPERDDFFACRLVPAKPLPPPVEDIVLAKKLRKVTAQVGFTRLSSVTPNLQGEYDEGVSMAALGLAENWLPATETRGEGVLIRFRESVVREWEDSELVQERAQRLFAGYRLEYGADADPRDFPGARYFFLHSLSHLLMNALSLECGYAAASLSERIYCAPANAPTPMAAILILTGTSGAEGTLGGLVEQGRHILRHLRRAYDMGTLCSNDPVCAAHQPGDGDHSERSLEGAACHGCLYVAEPSCERFNRYLDRALVVPTLGNKQELAFFRTRP
jgi:hypothetical protein